MSSMTTAAWIAVAALATAAGGSAYSGYVQNDASIDQKKAQDEARANAEKNAKAQEEATNLSAAQQAAKSGGSSTMLTGPGGTGAGTLGGQTSLLG
jgi:D-serine deaminase-like pyridoxal phosphate-dependent protein